MTEMPGMVERCARAVWEDGRNPENTPAWEELNDNTRHTYRIETGAAIAEYQAALRDAGMVIVPREPTEGMMRAAGIHYDAISPAWGMEAGGHFIQIVFESRDEAEAAFEEIERVLHEMGQIGTVCLTSVPPTGPNTDKSK